VHVTARWPGWALVSAGWLGWLATPVIGALAGHPTEAVRSTPQVVAYLLTGTVAYAMRPLSPVARRLLAFSVLLAAGYAIGTGYSAYLVKAGLPARGWLVILLIAAAYAGLAAAFGVAAGRRVSLDLAIVLTIVVTMVAAPVRRRPAGRPAGVRSAAVRL